MGPDRGALATRVSNGRRTRATRVAAATMTGSLALGLALVPVAHAQSAPPPDAAASSAPVLPAATRTPWSVRQCWPGISRACAGQPVVVVGTESKAAQLRSAFSGTSGITAVTPPSVRAGHAYLEGTLTVPPDSQAAYTTIDNVRSAVHAVPGGNALVGGNTAINLDVARASTHDRNVIIPVILAVVFLILALLLRAIVAPVMLIATVVLLRAPPSASARSSSTTCSTSAGRHLVPAVRLCVPCRPGHRLQHLPDDPGPGGGEAARDPARARLPALAATGGVITSARAGTSCSPCSARYRSRSWPNSASRWHSACC